MSAFAPSFIRGTRRSVVGVRSDIVSVEMKQSFKNASNVDDVLMSQVSFTVPGSRHARSQRS